MLYFNNFRHVLGLHVALLSQRGRECSLLLLELSYFSFIFTTVYIKCCSLVFGVTLRLLAINTSSSVSREQQAMLLNTSGESHQLAKGRRSCVYNT